MSNTTDKDIPGSSALLSEILSVLKKIDLHLEKQGTRINDLESKVTAICEVNSPVSSPAILREREPIQHTSLISERAKKGVFPLSTSFNRHGLAALSSNRNDGIDSRHATDSDPMATTHDAHTTNDFTRRGPLRSALVQTDSSRVVFAESPKAHKVPIIKFGPQSRSGTWNSFSPPPSSLWPESDEEIIESHDLTSYTKYPAPEHWTITRTNGRALEVKFGSQEAQSLWRRYVRDSWTIPPDGRIEMTFQQHILERLNETQAILLLKTLQGVSSKLEYRGLSDTDKRGSFRVKDYGFDPDYEVSVAEYRAEIPIGQFRRHLLPTGTRKNSLDKFETAPWKRVM